MTTQGYRHLISSLRLAKGEGTSSDQATSANRRLYVPARRLITGAMASIP